MAEESPGRISGWIKAGITSIMGLASGAILMYVSPLVNNVIKPGRPLANFSQQIQGTTVTFVNRSTGATDGWWDFGDGSALERFSPTQESIAHTYPRSGSYSVKLSVRSFLGDENERAVTVNLDGTTSTPPVIEAFTVVPVQKEATAPATFHIVSQIKNADLCIWTLGDDRPVDVSTDNSSYQERLVTINQPGFYTLRLVAVSGKQTVEKSQSVFVNVADAGTPTAVLQITNQVAQVQRQSKQVNLYAAFPPERKESSFPFSLTHVEGDYKIVDAKFVTPVKEPNVKNASVTIAPDKSKVVVTGELVKPGGIMAWQKNAPLPKWTPTLALTLERRTEGMTKTSDPIIADLALPGTTILPLPKLTKRWEVMGSKMHLELRDGTNIVFKDTKMPVSATVQFKNHPYRITATQGPDSIRLDVIDAKATLRPTGN